MILKKGDTIHVCSITLTKKKNSTPLAPTCCKGLPKDAVSFLSINNSKHFECKLMNILWLSCKRLKIFTFKIEWTDLSVHMSVYLKHLIETHYIWNDNTNTVNSIDRVLLLYPNFETFQQNQFLFKLIRFKNNLLNTSIK